MIHFGAELKTVDALYRKTRCRRQLEEVRLKSNSPTEKPWLNAQMKRVRYH